MYTAELINKRDVYFEADDVVLKFILRDEDGAMVTDFTGMSIEVEITDYASESTLQNATAGGAATEITTNANNEIVVYVPDTDTDGFFPGYFVVEMQITIGEKVYTVFHDKIRFKYETLDW